MRGGEVPTEPEARGNGMNCQRAVRHFDSGEDRCSQTLQKLYQCSVFERRLFEMDVTSVAGAIGGFTQDLVAAARDLAVEPVPKRQREGDEEQWAKRVKPWYEGS